MRRKQENAAQELPHYEELERMPSNTFGGWKERKKNFNRVPWSHTISTSQERGKAGPDDVDFCFPKNKIQINLKIQPFSDCDVSDNYFSCLLYYLSAHL